MGRSQVGEEQIDHFVVGLPTSHIVLAAADLPQHTALPFRRLR